MKKSVFLFPGQGSQKVGMISTFLEDFPSQTKKLFETANQICNRDLLELALEGPEEELSLTYYTQPVILTTSFLIFSILEKHAFEPEVVAGHSLGEYSALTCAKSIGFEEAVFLVHQRGKLMQEAVETNTGIMVAIIGLDLEEVEEMVSELLQQGRVEIANINGPDQVVISLEKTLENDLLSRARERGAKRAVTLNVSAPFHSSFMEPAKNKFAAFLENIDFKRPKYTYISNVTAKPVEEPQVIKELLIEQMTSTVRWKEIIDYLYHHAYRTFIEVGPGKVLGNLLKKQYPDVRVAFTHTSKNLKELLERGELS